jgi:hypothetical protein
MTAHAGERLLDRVAPNLALLLCAIAAAWLGTGCTSSTERLVPVAGTVSVEGEPLTVGWITFYPDEEKGNANPYLPFAQITASGTYELTTNGRTGAPPGAYKVVVATTHDAIPVNPPRGSDGKPWQPKWLTHEKYTIAGTTDLRIEVVEKPASGQYNLRLTR